MATCYGYTSFTNSIYPFALIKPCPGSTQCCASGDICLSNGICQFSHSQPAGIYSGYYVSGCTDSTYTDSTCIKQCTSLASANDIVFNYTSARWACCGRLPNGQVACNEPTRETFSAPAPANLAVLGATSSSLTVSSSMSSTPVITPTSTSTTSSPPTKSISAAPSNQSLGTGAIAGIVIGVILGLSFVVSISLWYFMRRRKQHSLVDGYRDSLSPQEKDGNSAMLNQAYHVSPQELSEHNGTRRYELGIGSNRVTQVFSQSTTTTK